MTSRKDGTRPVILCADDYAMNGGVSRSILRLAEAGRLSATSCMTNAPDWRQLAAELPTREGRLAIGLHVTLTWGGTLGPAPGLAPHGVFGSLGPLLGAALSGRLPAHEVQTEIARQLDAFEDVLGRPPDFVDGHQHVHVLAGIRGPLFAELRRRGLQGRVWLRDPSDTFDAIVARRLCAGKALFVGALSAGFERRAHATGFATNRGFSGFSPFDPARDLDRDMRRHLSHLGPKALVMSHPGLPDPDPTDEIAASRVREHDYLGSNAFGELLVERRIRLVGLP